MRPLVIALVLLCLGCYDPRAARLAMEERRDAAAADFCKNFGGTHHIGDGIGVRYAVCNDGTWAPL